MPSAALDFERLFALAPNPYMVLDRDLRFVAANAAYLAVTGTTAEALLGKQLFEVFPHDPEDLDNPSARQLRGSLERVLATGRPDELALIAYGVSAHAARGHEPVERFWSATHTPLLDERGEVTHILQNAVDVTALLRTRLPQETADQRQAGLLRRAEAVQTQSRLVEIERQHLRRLFDQAPGFVCFLRGPEHVYELTNPAYQQLVGHRKVLGLSVREALPEVAGQGYFEQLDRVFATGEPFVGHDLHAQLQRTPGAAPEACVLDLVYQPIIEPDGSVSGIFVSGYDKTEQHRATADRERLATIIEQSSDWVASCGPDGLLSYANDAAQRMLGLTAEQLPRTHGAQCFAPEDLPFVQQVIWPAVERDGRWEGDFRMRHFVTGEAIPVHYNVFAIKDPEEGTLRAVASVSRDARERVALLGARQAAEAAQRFLADSIPEQVWTSGPDGALTYVNQRVTRYFGRSREQMLGQGWQGVVHPEDLESVLARWHHSLATGTPYEVEFRLQRSSDRSYRWHIVRALPFRDEKGAIVTWYGSNTDIEDQKRGVRERDRLIAALEQSNRELDRFAYVASHDLKSPLRGIAHLAEWIEEDAGEALGEASRRNLQLLRGRVYRMNALIEGVLSYARSGRSTEPACELDVGKLVAEAVELIAPPPTVTITLAPMPTIRSVAVPLQQVFLNLIGNGVKHAKRADAHVSVSVEDLGDRHRYTVEDNGQGIDPRFHARIFEMFQTLESRDKVEGTGIGLSVVKKIVEGRGGQVSVDSKPGDGSRFAFTWPKFADVG